MTGLAIVVALAGFMAGLFALVSGITNAALGESSPTRTLGLVVGGFFGMMAMAVILSALTLR